MDFLESRSRIVDVINNLAAFAPSAFAQRQGTLIPTAAVVVIDGEPMNILQAAPPVA